MPPKPHQPSSSPPTNKKRGSRILAPDPAERVPPTGKPRVTALRPVGADASAISIVVGTTSVAKVDATWATSENLHEGPNVHPGMPWTPELATRVYAAARRHAAFAHAARLIGARQRSAADLTRKLALSGHTASDAEAAVDALRGCGLIDDQALAARLADELARAGTLGEQGIRFKLQTRGIPADLARAASHRAMTETGDTDAALTLAQKRAARLERLEPQVARRRLYGFLLRRGFGHDQARRATDAALTGGSQPNDLHS